MQGELGRRLKFKWSRALYDVLIKRRMFFPVKRGTFRGKEGTFRGAIIAATKEGEHESVGASGGKEERRKKMGENEVDNGGNEWLKGNEENVVGLRESGAEGNKAMENGAKGNGAEENVNGLKGNGAEENVIGLRGNGAEENGIGSRENGAEESVIGLKENGAEESVIGLKENGAMENVIGSREYGAKGNENGSKQGTSQKNGNATGSLDETTASSNNGNRSLGNGNDGTLQIVTDSMESTEPTTTEFEQIISEESTRFVEIGLDLTNECLEAGTHLFFFAKILYELSPKLGRAALATAFGGTMFSIMYGKMYLERLFVNEMETTGALSRHLLRVRENLESIQFSNGVEVETERAIVLDLAKQQAVMERKRGKDASRIFSTAIRRTAGIALPSLFLKEKDNDHDAHDSHSHSHSYAIKPNPTHGSIASTSKDSSNAFSAQLSQASEAFDEILFHLLLASENLHDVARLETIANNICTNVLDVTTTTREENTYLNDSLKNRQSGEPNEFSWFTMKNLTVCVPEKPAQVLIRNCTLDLKYGDSLLVTGVSGSGKTALLRVAAGIWPALAGEIDIPRTSKIMFLPQKPFCPWGTLRDQVAYPKKPVGFSDKTIVDALTAVGLGGVVGRYGLDTVRPWAEELSLGEQQRLAFARVFAQRPEFLLMDEATSACDAVREASLYSLITDIVKGGFVSVGHRRSIEKYHLRKIVMKGTEANGAWEVEF